MSRIYLSHLRSKARRSLRHGLDGRPGNRASQCFLMLQPSVRIYRTSLCDALETFATHGFKTGTIYPALSEDTWIDKPSHLLFRSRNGTPYAERL